MHGETKSGQTQLQEQPQLKQFLAAPIWITPCARLRTFILLAGLVTYLSLTPGIRGAAGSVGTQG